MNMTSLPHPVAGQVRIGKNGRLQWPHTCTLQRDLNDIYSPLFCVKFNDNLIRCMIGS